MFVLLENLHPVSSIIWFFSRTYHNSFCTSLRVTRDNVAEIARAGRARWKIENETFNTLARNGYHLKYNFGHGKDGLANLLATLLVFAFALHSLLDGACQLWRQCREKLVTRRNFFEDLRCLGNRIWCRDWIELLEIVLGVRQLVAVPT